MKPTPLILLAWLVVLSTLLPGLDHGIWRPDEPQVAGICAEAARTRDFVVPRLNGRPFLEKPPLYYDAAALSGMILGTGSGVPFRLVSLGFGLLTLALVNAMVRRRSGPAAGVAAAGILASTWGFFMMTRWIQVDTALVFSIALSMYLYLRIQERPTKAGSALLGLALGISFMAKGLVGPAMFAMALLVDMALKKDPGVLWRTRPHIAALTAALPVAPWIWGLYSQGGWPFLRETLLVNNLMRFLGSPEGAALGHQKGPFFYFAHLPAEYLPWTLVLIPALALSIRRFREDPFLPWLAGPFILLCLSSTKRSVYLAPLFPAMACLVSAWLMEVRARKPWEDWMVKATWAIAVIGCAAPLAMGIMYGLPAFGAVMSVLSAAALAALRYGKALSGTRDLSLVLAVCVAMTCAMAVDFPGRKPGEDYLAFAREALQASAGRQVTVFLGENEILEGVLPMVRGSVFPLKKANDDLPAGLYAWVETRSRDATEALSEFGAIEVLVDRKLGSKHAFLALFTPAVKQENAPQ
jgi:4-amino-4-deoxy-L-arabinose transferase-like glycosyltransferase